MLRASSISRHAMCLYGLCPVARVVTWSKPHQSLPLTLRLLCAAGSRSRPDTGSQESGEPASDTLEESTHEVPVT